MFCQTEDDVEALLTSMAKELSCMDMVTRTDMDTISGTNTKKRIENQGTIQLRYTTNINVNNP